MTCLSRSLYACSAYSEEVIKLLLHHFYVIHELRCSSFAPGDILPDQIGCVTSSVQSCVAIVARFESSLSREFSDLDLGCEYVTCSIND